MQHEPVAPRKQGADEFLRLDGAAYAHGARLATQGGNSSVRTSRALFALTRPVLIPSYLRLLRALPVITVSMSPTHHGELLRSQLAGLSWRQYGGFAQLLLPSSLAEYLRGRSMQAVRTNLNHARAHGLRVAPVAVKDRESVLANFSRHASALSRPERPHDLAEPDVAWFAAWSGEDVLGMAMTGHDGSTALLRALLGPEDQERASEVRYLLHTTVVEHLIGHGVETLLLAAAVSAPAGQKYFAARLGYHACRVRLVPRTNRLREAVLRRGGGSRARAARSPSAPEPVPAEDAAPPA